MPIFCAVAITRQARWYEGQLHPEEALTREQAERQVEQLHGGMLVHVFSSCDATLAKTPFVVELASFAWPKITS